MHDYYLDQIGVTQYRLRSKPNNEWQELHEAVKNCQLCPLHQSRTNAVFGVGDHSAEVFIIGEAPGFNEDQQGEPFVGRAGQLLNQILRAVGFSREQVFISNVLKCRPPENRDPQATEVLQCTPYLAKQVELIQPKVIVALGRHAAHYLLDSTDSLYRLREQSHFYGKQRIPVLVTYHPAYLLRNSGDKAKAFQDWQRLHQWIPAQQQG